MNDFFKRHLKCLRVQIKECPKAFIGVFEGISLCWIILAIPCLILALLIYSGQGRESIFVATEGSGLILYMLLTLGSVQSFIFATILLEDWRLKADSNIRLFIKHSTPFVIGLISGYAFPLLAQNSHKLLNDGVRGMGIVLEMSTVFILITLRHSMARDTKTIDEGDIVPLFLIGSVAFFSFIFTGINSVFTRFVIFAVTVPTIDWFFPSAYLKNPDVKKCRIKYLMRVGSVFSLIFILTGYWLMTDPVVRGPKLGPAPVILLSFFFWLSIAFFIILGLYRLYYTRLIQAYPFSNRLIGFCIILFIAFHIFKGPFNERAIRTLPGTSSVPRQDISIYMESWIDFREKEISLSEKYPVFFVAAEGGGIRAAYWTATILASLQDAYPSFGGHILGITGVSGGSLGASIFAGSMKASFLGSSSLVPCFGFLSKTRSIVRHDFLSAPLSVMLIGDIAKCIFPFGRIKDFDRAKALEESVENAWLTTTGTDVFKSPFEDLWADPQSRFRVPLLFPNCTCADSGKHIVISPVKLPENKGSVIDLSDFLNPKNLSLSTATFLSARFPVISPTGVYTPDVSHTPFRIVDGGYYDNSGASTLSDLICIFETVIKVHPLKEKIFPIVIMISNSPAETIPPHSNRVSHSTIGSLTDPLLTLDRVRSVSCERFQNLVKDQMKRMGGIVLENLNLIHGKDDLPLGWMLSEKTADIIDEKLKLLQEDNQSDFKTIGKYLEQEH